MKPNSREEIWIIRLNYFHNFIDCTVHNLIWSSFNYFDFVFFILVIIKIICILINDTFYQNQGSLSLLASKKQLSKAWNFKEVIDVGLLRLRTLKKTSQNVRPSPPIGFIRNMLLRWEKFMSTRLSISAHLGVEISCLFQLHQNIDWH